MGGAGRFRMRGILKRGRFQPISTQPFSLKNVNRIESLRSIIMTTESKKIYRSRENRMIFGVCSGLANFFGIDPTVVRLLFAVGTILGFGSFFLIYIVLFVVVPEEPQAPA
jgi:phage shock protein C